MTPQGESTGLAIEDAVLFARVVEKHPTSPIQGIFDKYTKTRKARIHTAYKHATERWRVYDKSWLMNKFEEWATWIYL
jgi:2-polyprenyl-6-methoxyphenol hydroxylase-like FAD-dependent oxidoreductase